MEVESKVVSRAVDIYVLEVTDDHQSGCLLRTQGSRPRCSDLCPGLLRLRER